MDRVTIKSKLTMPRRFESFFGPVILDPGLNPSINIKLWKNLKANNPDVQSLVEKGLLQEVND